MAQGERKTMCTIGLQVWIQMLKQSGTGAQLIHKWLSQIKHWLKNLNDIYFQQKNLHRRSMK